MAASRQRARLALAAATLASALTGAAEPAFKADLAGEIVFTSNRAEDLDGEIYAIQTDGSRRRNLSRGPRYDGDLKPSPDGREIAFVSTRSGAIAIWTVNVDGSDLRRVSGPLGTSVVSGTPQIDWAPSGRQLLYVARSNVYVLNLGNGRSSRIGRGTFGSWSPDGSRIAYVRYTGSTARVVVVRPNGQKLWKRIGSFPRWSPDGAWIGFSSTHGSKNVVVVATAAGRTLQELPADSFQSWSPNGRYVIVMRKNELQVVSLRSGTRKGLTEAYFARWSPNGKLIAFAGRVGRRRGLYLFDIHRWRARYLAPSNWVADWAPGSDALLVNVDTALETMSLSGRRRTLIRAVRTSSFGGGANWLPHRTIVFSSRPRNNPPADLYRFSVTQGVVRMTHAPFVSGQPRWSPDGQRIAFVRGLQTADCKGTCETEIYVADSNGQNVKRLTRYRGDLEPFVSSPTWSPTGDRIAFSRSGAGGDTSIRVVAATGGREQVLIRSDEIEYLDPAWSPDGTKIAFGSDRQNGGIFVMSPDGSNVRKLTGATGLDPPGAPAWSPDGSRIAFVGDIGAEPLTIYVMNADGSGKTLLGPGSEPAWSPDSDWIAYVGIAGEKTALRNYEIFAMRPDGSESHAVTTDPGDEYAPSWKR
jgi:Tol biopolymer transport system component